ncbi:MAG: hypothetical protein NWQ74_00075 [Opitutales bacterium]|jgi:hypothetical protein|nr:hypothetical protein [Opitutales bacterium]MDP4657918.1 hypothetical protein [Opitutales bacterium]MDP4775147.1 hypothetical protein [Opitutales bacterium]MDP4787086.1 hypothetical protein [Opitutales bacterium]MDP4860316.1 hypothetical protein [Opitutales bacterium]
MPNNPPSDFKRNLRREVAGYFIVVLCALPIRFWLYSFVQDQDGWLGFLAGQAFGYLTIGLVSAVFVSKLSLRTRLILTFLIVAL